jgi:hypothetical protein
MTLFALGIAAGCRGPAAVSAEPLGSVDAQKPGSSVASGESSQLVSARFPDGRLFPGGSSRDETQVEVTLTHGFGWGSTR